MKPPKNLYSRLSLITSVTIVFGYFIVSAAWTSMGTVNTGENMSSSLWNNLVGNVNDLNNRVNSTMSSLWSTGATNSVKYNAGKVEVGSISGNAELDIKSGGNPHWGIYHDDTSKELRFWNVSNQVVFGSGGNVGIGITNPSSPLDIRGHLQFDEGNGSVTNGSDIHFDAQGLIAADSSLYINTDATNDGVGNIYFSKGADTTAATKLVTILNNGNVGIGVTNPSAKLELTGAIKSDMLTLTDNTYQSTVTGALNINSNNGAILLDDSGQKRISWNDGAGNFNIRSGNYFQTGTGIVFVKGSSSADGGASNITMSSDGTNGQITLGVAAIGAAGSPVNWNNRLILTTTKAYFSDGNLGVGTSSPEANSKLDVAGQIKIGDGSTTCNASRAGVMRWNGTGFYGCNGTAWVRLDN